MRVAWLPFETRAEAVQAIGEFPDDIEVVGFLNGALVPDDPARVQFCCLPYMNGSAVLDRAAELTSLEVVQSQSAGVDDIVARVPSGVVLCNAGGVHDAATAEIALALALAQGRHLDDYARQRGQWDKQWGTGLADQRVLIIGYGNIGKAIEARLAGFETASITRVARSARTEAVDGEPRDVHAFAELPDLLPTADIVFVIAPLTPDTEGLFDAGRLSLLPDNALVVNVGRGPIIDTDALLAETSSGRLRAALDVTDPEPLPADHPLWQSPNVLISPHVGGLGASFLPRRNRLIGDQLRRWAAGEPLANQIDH